MPVVITNPDELTVAVPLPPKVILYRDVFSKIVERMNYRKVSIVLILFIMGLTFFISGGVGIVVLIVSMFLGFLPLLLKVNRNHLMCSLIIPVIVYFLV